MLKQDYKEGEMTLKSALALAIKVLNKTMDVSKLSAEKGNPCIPLLCQMDRRASCPGPRPGHLRSPNSGFTRQVALHILAQ